MVSLSNHTYTVVFESSPSTVFDAGSIPKDKAVIKLYNDGQGVVIDADSCIFTMKVTDLNPAFVSAHNLTDDKSLFDLLVAWQNERIGNS